MTATDYLKPAAAEPVSSTSADIPPADAVPSPSASEPAVSGAAFFVEQPDSVSDRPHADAPSSTSPPRGEVEGDPAEPPRESAPEVATATADAETTVSAFEVLEDAPPSVSPEPGEVGGGRPEEFVGTVEPSEDSPAQFTTDPAAVETAFTAETQQTLQQELQQALAKSAEYWSLYLGARAEMDNLLKRSEREIQNARRFALQEFIGALLPVKDSLEMGIAAASDTTDIAKLREGSELTLKILTGILEKAGVQELDPTGAKFNPERHEAMATQPSESVEPNTVLHVVQKGYVLNDRLIRPARVILSRAP